MILGCFRSSMASLLPEEIKIGPYVQELLNAILLSALSKSINFTNTSIKIQGILNSAFWK